MGATLECIEYVLGDVCQPNSLLKEEFNNYDFDRFEKKVGIKERYILSATRTALDLAVEACEQVFLSVDRQSIDYILYCTQSPDYLLPTTACILQDKLGLREDIGALDFNLGCSGYTYGLNMAASLISGGDVKRILLVTAEGYSQYIHNLDRMNRSLFSDAASASVISYSEESDVGKFLFGTDGSGYDKLIVKNGGARHEQEVDATLLQYGSGNYYTNNNLYMDGPAIFNFSTSKIPEFLLKILNNSGINKSDVNQFILHQANAFMLNFIRKKTGINKDNFYIDISRGNTVSSTIPIALKDYSQNISQFPQQILLLGFGVGLSWSGGLITIKNKL